MSGDNPEPAKKINRYFNLTMVFIYAGIGLSLVFTPVLIDTIPSNRIIIGCALIAYSAFRIYLILTRK